MKQFTKIPIILIVLTCTLWIFGCSKLDRTSSMVVDVFVKAIIENNSGQDMLNPDVNGHFNKENIKIINLVNGQEKEYYQPNLDLAKGFRINNLSGKFIIDIVPTMPDFAKDVEYDKKTTTTYIEWLPGNRDTILTVITYTRNGRSSSIRTEEIWLNGTKVFPDKAANGIVKIIK